MALRRDGRCSTDRWTLAKLDRLSENNDALLSFLDTHGIVSINRQCKKCGKDDMVLNEEQTDIFLTCTNSSSSSSSSGSSSYSSTSVSYSGSGSGSRNFHVGYKRKHHSHSSHKDKSDDDKKDDDDDDDDDAETEKFKAEGTFEEEHKSVRTHQRKTKKKFKKKKKSEKDGGGDNNQDDQPIVVPVEESIGPLLNPESLNQENATITEAFDREVEKKTWPFEGNEQVLVEVNETMLRQQEVEEPKVTKSEENKNILNSNKLK